MTNPSARMTTIGTRPRTACSDNFEVDDLRRIAKVYSGVPCKCAQIRFGQGLDYHMHSYMQRIDEIEDDIAATIRKRHPSELEVVHAALSQILRGLDDFGTKKGRPDSRLESARLFLSTRSFNSIRIALLTLEKGYYQQALTLVRMAKEDQLIAQEIEKCPQTLTALLDGQGRFSKRNLSLGKMAERISPSAKGVWNDDYGTLSKRGAHPRVESMKGLIAIDPDGQLTLRAGSHYDEVEVNAVLYYLVRTLEEIMETVAKLTYPVGSRWMNDALTVFNEVDSPWRRIDEWAGEELARSD